MEKKELSCGRVFILIGALMAFLIGSGFASGQETVQYFTGYGVVGGFLVGTFNFVMIYIAYVAYAYAGRTRNLRNLNEVASFYAGPVRPWHGSSPSAATSSCLPALPPP